METVGWMISFKTETYIALTSALISFCTLWAVWYGAFLTRKHNRLSVRPSLTDWVQAEWDNGWHSFCISNHGLGPAVIKSFKVYIDGKEIESEGQDVIQKAKDTIFPNAFIELDYSFVGEGYIMPIGKTINIFKLTKGEDCEVTYEQLFDQMKRTTLQIEYESLYGEKFLFRSIEDNFRLS